MCGISGILYKASTPRRPAPIGEDLVNMLESLTHRGRDSSGVTVAGEPIDGDLVIRVWTDREDRSQEVLARSEDTVLKAGGVVTSKGTWGAFLRLVVNYEGEIPALANALLETEGVELHSIGEASEVVKDVGAPVVIDGFHGINHLRGTHGIGHVRMATESRVDISHAHPFWAFPFPDVTVVHNGQLTNYHKLRRMYEDREYRFQTDNDSELIAVYLADHLARGETLEQALRGSLDDLDGTFTYLVSTKQGLGYAKDRWSAKPLVIMETSDVVAMASEEVALRSVFSEEIERVEPQDGEVMTWLI